MTVARYLQRLIAIWLTPIWLTPIWLTPIWLTPIWLTLCVLQVGAMGEESARNSLDAVVHEVWEQHFPQETATTPFDLWRSRITPPFPVVWPPEREPRFYRYAYAYRIDPGLSDGEYQAAPWARIEVRSPEDALPHLELLGDELREIGIQGVTPLGEKELAIRETGAAVERSLLSLTGPLSEQRARDIRAYYCGWLEHNGVVAEEIELHHSAFIRWLDCSS